MLGNERGIRTGNERNQHWELYRNLDWDRERNQELELDRNLDWE